MFVSFFLTLCFWSSLSSVQSTPTISDHFETSSKTAIDVETFSKATFHSYAPPRNALITRHTSDKSLTTEIIFHYTCRRSGRRRRAFRVKVQFLGSTGKVSLHNAMNIQRFTEFNQIDEYPAHTYEGFMEGRHCVHYTRTHHCKYFYKAFIEGEVTSEGIVTTVAEDLTFGGYFAPVVTEECVYINIQPSMGEICPLDDDDEAGPDECAVRRLEKNIIRPR